MSVIYRRAVLEGYSPTQPRRSDGKFGTKGAGGPAPSGGTITPEDAQVRLADAGVEAYADLAFGHKGVLRRVDPTLLPDIVEGFEAIHREYPGIKSSGTTISLRGDPLEEFGLVAETNSMSTRVADPNGHHQTSAQISLNTAMWADEVTLRMNLETQKSKGWLTDGTPTGIIKHEMGHVAHGVLQADVDPAYRKAAAANAKTGVSGYADARDPESGEPYYHERFAEQFTSITNGGSRAGKSPDYDIVAEQLKKLPMTVQLAPMCLGCRHLKPVVPGEQYKCEAFPDGIPGGILSSEVDHRQPVAGDNGIRLDPESPEWAAYVDGLFPAAPSAPATNGYQAYQQHVILAYSPGQKRDNVGRFGSGGGGGGAGVAGPTPDGMAGRQELEDAHNAQIRDRQAGSPLPPTGGVPYEAIAAVSRDQKVFAMQAVGRDLDKQFTVVRLEEAASAMRDAEGPDGFHGTTAGERMADAMLSTWQQGAYSTSKPDSVAFQVAVGQEFGVGVGRHIQSEFDDAGQKVDAWPATLGYDMPVMKAAVRSMYDHTQKKLDDMGVGDTVTLHRGIGSDVRDDVDVDLNAASSWSHDANIAAGFANDRSDELHHGGQGGTILTTTVKRKRILSMPGQGAGCFEESEYIVLRADGDRARGVAAR